MDPSEETVRERGSSRRPRQPDIMSADASANVEDVEETPIRAGKTGNTSVSAKCHTCSLTLYHQLHEGYRKLHCKQRIRRTFSLATLRQRLPPLRWLPTYKTRHLQGDLIAGLTVGLTVIPQSLAYAKIAELPPQYGLYSAFMACFVYFILGTSKDVNLGPTAVMSLLTAQFGHSAVEGDATYAIALAFVSGLVQIGMGLLQLGFVVDFISHPVINSFTTAAAITIASSQLKNLFGLHNIRRGFIYEVYDVLRKLPETQIWDLCLGVICIVFLYLMKKMKDVNWTTRWTKTVISTIIQKTIWIASTARNAIIVIISASLAAILYHNDSVPFSLTGNITGGIPPFSVPDFTLSTSENVTYTVSDAFSAMGIGVIVVPAVGIIEIIAVGKAFGRKHGYNVDADQEFYALGIANLLGSFVSAYPITASFSRSAVNAQSGSMTTAAGVITGALVLLALGLLTPLFFYIPDAALAAVIIMAITDMVDFSMIPHLWKVNKLDLLPWFTAFLISLIVGFEYGIILGVVVSILLLLQPWVRPPVQVKPYVPDDLDSTAKVNEDIAVVTVAMGLMFPGIEHLQKEILSASLHHGAGGPRRPVIVDLSHVQTLDYTAAVGLADVAQDFKKLKTWLVFINVNHTVASKLKLAKVKICKAESLQAAVHMISTGTLEDGIVIQAAIEDEFVPFAVDPSCIAYHSYQYRDIGDIPDSSESGENRSLLHGQTTTRNVALDSDINLM